MGRPSIFSKDYEKIMRRRRRRFTIITIILVCIVGVAAFKAVNYDYSALKDRLQKWVNEPSNIENNNEGAQVVDSADQEQPPKETEDNSLLEEPQVEKDVYLDVDFNGTKISFKIEEDTNDELAKDNSAVTNNTGDTNNITNSEEEKNQGSNAVQENIADKAKKITAVKEVPAGFVVEISSTGKKALVSDSNQNLYVVDPAGEVKNTTLAQYVAPDGEVFEKEAVRNTYQGYLWSISPKFISDEKIAYISNIPYFGIDLKKYISVVELNTNSHIILWGSKGTEITFGGMQEKGLEVQIDGNSCFIDANGDLVY